MLSNALYKNYQLFLYNKAYISCDAQTYISSIYWQGNPTKGDTTLVNKVIFFV
jgi:hypothetical protein